MTIDEFLKVELRLAKVKAAERVEGSDKLVRLQVDAGDRTEAGELIDRQVLAGIGKTYAPEELLGKSIVIVANLEPRKLMGLESQGMLLAASDETGALSVLTVEKDVAPGSRIK